MASSTGGVRSRQKPERVSGAAESSHPEAEGPEGPRPQASSELARVRQRREVKRVTWSSERVAREGKVKAAGGGGGGNGPSFFRGVISYGMKVMGLRA